MRVLFLLAVLAAVGYGLWLVGRRVWQWWDARRTAKSKWTVETRPRKRTAKLSAEVRGDDEWLVVLHRPGEEQIFRTVVVGDNDGLLEAQADADAHAHVLNEGRRK